MDDGFLKHNQLARRALWELQRAVKKRNLKKLAGAQDAFADLLDVMSPAHPDRPACLGNLSTALRLQYEWSQDVSAVERLVDVDELIRRSLDPADPQRALHRHNLRNVMVHLMTGPRRPGLLARAVPLAREAAADPAERTLFLEALVACLDELFEQTEDEHVMVELIALDRERLAARHPDDPEVGPILADLGAGLRTLALLRGRPEDLPGAVAVGRQAVGKCPDGHENRAFCLALLANSLHARFVQLDRSMETLRESVTVARQAVAAAPPGHPDRPAALNGLGIGLRSVFEEARELDALHEAAQVLQDAVAELGPDEPARRARYLGNLSAVHQELFKRTGETRAILAAVEASREAVRLSPHDTPQRAGRLSDLGNALHILSTGLYFAAPGDEDAVTTGTEGPVDLPYLREAVEVARAAVAGTRDDPDLGGRLSNLSVTTRTLYELTGDTEALDEAVRAARAGVAAATADTTNHATALMALVRALAQRPAAPDVLHEMQECCKELATATTTPRTRVIAHLLLGRTAMSATPPEAATALAAYEKAVGWLPEIAPRQLLRPDREYGLGELSGLPAEAASAALHLGRPEHALLLLEHARGLLLREGMSGRDDLTEVRRADPEAADDLVRLRDLLNASDQGGVDLYRGDGNAAPRARHGNEAPRARHGARARRHRELALEWEQLLDRIRSRPGLEGFLLPPTIESLRRRPVDGPVVLVNPGPARCDALLLTPDGGVRALRLDCDHVELRERARAFRRLPRSAGGASPDEAELLGHLAWLWDRIGRPVLSELGLLSPVRLPAEAAPRIWWCPIGVAASLPLHAAGRHDAADPAGVSAVMDHVVSSYTSTVHALQRGRKDGHSASAHRPLGRSPGQPLNSVLVVEMSKTPGAGPLPGARLEAERLTELAPQPTVLSGPGATREAVLRELPGHTVAHFACHAVTDPRSPSLDRLLLHDHGSTPLTAVELSSVHVPNGTLAYLSACETAKSDERLADEAIHIATAFQLAGYRHVIGTLWPVADSAAGRIADDFYTGLTRSPDAADAARTLHRAVLELREDAAGRPSRWAAHVHFGG
ncbi:CHAT domain-containing protein [Streptomyces justiciae]|uniref:CHAT domain-containing protein n=1 Tax=Streptomyces justiciae TaxID=2780140 RepID=UPI0018803DB1|nr:CHAT domain-containing protein [Streptomyces justiciae]MBE8470525.1 CHAT domain-containing protein [Streptomyces justiciae]